MRAMSVRFASRDSRTIQRIGRDAGNASCPKPSAAFSLKLAWRQTAPLPEHRFATRYRAGYALGFPPWAGVSPSPWTLPLRGEAGRWPALVVARGAAKLPRPRAAADAHFAALPLVRSPATRSARLPSLRSAHFAPRRASPLARHFRPAGGLGRSPITPKSRSSKERRLRA